MNLNQFIKKLQEIQAEIGEDESEELIVATNERSWMEYEEIDSVEFEFPSIDYPLNLNEMRKTIDGEQSFLLIG